MSTSSHGRGFPVSSSLPSSDFETIYRRWFDRVRRWVRRLGAPASREEDLAQGFEHSRRIVGTVAAARRGTGLPRQRNRENESARAGRILECRGRSSPRGRIRHDALLFRSGHVGIEGGPLRMVTFRPISEQQSTSHDEQGWSSNNVSNEYRIVARRGIEPGI